MPPTPAAARTTPPLWALHLLFLMTGTGTTMLGPILPVLMRTWQLHDSQAGALLAAQFLGAFMGGASVGSNVRRSLLTASAAAAAGLGVFALASSHSGGMPLSMAALLLAGFGIGHMIASNNIIGSHFPAERRARTLTLLNLSWSLGAILSPILAAWLLPHLPLHLLLGVFAALFACAGCAVYVRLPAPPDAIASSEEAGATRNVVLFFGTMMLLYGGVETCMNGWLTTYILRYGDHTLSGSQLSTSLFWIALIAGRLFTAALLNWIRERGLLRLALGATTLCIAALVRAHTSISLMACAVLLGLSMAACFPVCFSIMAGYRPRARQAGAVIAVSGIGAALFPWLSGLVSTRTGSLHTGLVVPLLAVAAMFIMSLLLPRADQPPTPSS
ncbi:MAG TPA: MFS transporter [Acidobacteriaceae bacterium]